MFPLQPHGFEGVDVVGSGVVSVGQGSQIHSGQLHIGSGVYPTDSFLGQGSHVQVGHVHQICVVVTVVVVGDSVVVVDVVSVVSIVVSSSVVIDSVVVVGQGSQMHEQLHLGSVMDGSDISVNSFLGQGEQIQAGQKHKSSVVEVDSVVVEAISVVVVVVVGGGEVVVVGVISVVRKGVVS